MDPNENIENQPVQSTAKASPFADSPYLSPYATEHTESEIPRQETPVYENDAPVVPKKKHGSKFLKGCIAGLLVIALVAAGCGITGFGMSVWYAHQTEELEAQFQKQIDALKEEIEKNSFTGNGNSVSGSPIASEGLTPGQVYAQNKKSVVAISNQGTTNIFGQTTQTASAGSGFILSEDGYIVSNYHVVEAADTLTVITSDGSEYSATLVGYEEHNDLALLKIEATGLPAVTLGSSSDLIVGDQVVAIGNPLGELTNTLTVGYVSAKDRDVTTDGTIINMLQTDAAINPGNSGGPLFNMKGEVIGITTAKYSGTTTSGASIEGIGFANPIDDVSDMINELMEKGFVSTPYMGITISNRTNFGVYVESVDAGSAAEAAGMKAGDIIVGLGEYETTTTAELDKALHTFAPYDTTTVSVYRNRVVLELTITFAEKNQATATP